MLALGSWKGKLESVISTVSQPARSQSGGQMVRQAGGQALSKIGDAIRQAHRHAVGRSV